MAQIPDKTVVHNGVACDVHKHQYGNGRVALALVDRADGSPYTTATVNLPETDLPAGHVFVKNYSENEGVLPALVAAGVVGEPVGRVGTGWVQADLCPLLV